MPTKKKQTKLSKLGKLLKPTSFRKGMLLFAIAFAVLGGGALVVSHAASPGTQVLTRNRITATACKTYVNAFGGVYKVTVLFTKATATPSYRYGVADYRQPYTLEGSDFSSNSYWNNVVGTGTTNASIPLKDFVHVVIYDGSSTASSNGGVFLGAGPDGGTGIPWSKISNC